MSALPSKVRHRHGHHGHHHPHHHRAHDANGNAWNRAGHSAHEPNLANAIAGMEESCHKDYGGPRAHRGHCAHGVIDGLNAGGMRVPGADAEKLAKILEDPSRGSRQFHQVNVEEINHPKAGDVMFIKPFGKHEHGHVALYNGRQWVSDFHQANWNPYSAHIPVDPSRVTVLRNDSFAAQADQRAGHNHGRPSAPIVSEKPPMNNETPPDITDGTGNTGDTNSFTPTQTQDSGFSGQDSASAASTGHLKHHHTKHHGHGHNHNHGGHHHTEHRNSAAAPPTM